MRVQNTEREAIVAPMASVDSTEGIPGNTQALTVFGVDYLHVNFPNGDDLYVTEHGRPYLGNILPESVFSDREWFRSHSTALSLLGPRSAATSSSFKVRTKPWRGKSIDVVLKWNRMGQEVPDSRQVESLWYAEFNSPYEEFALLFEMRNSARESPGRIRTHKPLAIYVPHEQVSWFELDGSRAR